LGLYLLINLVNVPYLIFILINYLSKTAYFQRQNVNYEYYRI